MSVDRVDPDEDLETESESLEEMSRRIKNDDAFSEEVREVASVILKGIREGRIDANDP